MTWKVCAPAHDVHALSAPCSGCWRRFTFGRRTGTLTAEAQMFSSSCMSVKTLQVKQTEDALHLVQPCQAANSRSSW